MGGYARRMARVGSVLETVLYASDLGAAARFYAEVIGLTLVGEMDDLSIALRVGPEAVLLVFDPARSSEAGRVVPSHGAVGAGHVAFRIADGDYDAWLARLRDAGVAIEQEHGWGARGRSIYVRDPAGNSVELITADIWPGA